MKRILSIVITAILAGAFAFTGLAPASASPEKGPLHIEKNCSQYDFSAGSFCTITKSNRKMIPIGSQVTYLGVPGDGVLNVDIRLDTTSGNSAYGHVFLNVNQEDPNFGTGIVTFNGGIGTFEGFHARAAVNPLVYPNWAWDGTYSFDDD